KFLHLIGNKSLLNSIVTIVICFYFLLTLKRQVKLSLFFSSYFRILGVPTNCISRGTASRHPTSSTISTERSQVLDIQFYSPLWLVTQCNSIGQNHRSK